MSDRPPPYQKGDYYDNEDENQGSSSNSRQLSRPVRQHLTRVYGTLATVSASAAAGSYAYVQDILPINPSLLSFLGFILFAGIIFTRHPQHSTSTQLMRFGALNLFGFFQGTTIGPLIDGLLDINPAIVTQGLVLTLLVFASFTGTALYSQRRSWLYAGGLLSSAISILLWVGFINIFVGSSMLFSAELYIGLLAFAGFVAYDTQMIVERADLGDRDYVTHGADLFVDLFGLLVRILIILGRKEDSDSSKRKKKK